MANHTSFVSSWETHAISLNPLEGSGQFDIYLMTFAAIFGLYLLQSITTQKSFKAPYVGFRSVWEPRFLVGFRFSNGALAHITEGYNKVRNSHERV